MTRFAIYAVSQGSIYHKLYRTLGKPQRHYAPVIPTKVAGGTPSRYWLVIHGELRCAKAHARDVSGDIIN